MSNWLICQYLKFTNCKSVYEVYFFKKFFFYSNRGDTWKLHFSAFSVKVAVRLNVNKIRPTEKPAHWKWKDVDMKYDGGYFCFLLTLSRWTLTFWICKPQSSEAIENKWVGLWSLQLVKKIFFFKLRSSLLVNNVKIPFVAVITPVFCQAVLGYPSIFLSVHTSVCLSVRDSC